MGTNRKTMIPPPRAWFFVRPSSYMVSTPKPRRKIPSRRMGQACMVWAPETSSKVQSRFGTGPRNRLCVVVFSVVLVVEDVRVGRDFVERREGMTRTSQLAAIGLRFA